MSPSEVCSDGEVIQSHLTMPSTHKPYANVNCVKRMTLGATGMCLLQSTSYPVPGGVPLSSPWCSSREARRH